MNNGEVMSSKSRASSRSSPTDQGLGGFNSQILGNFACEVGPGCLIGIGALRSKAQLPDAWKWSEVKDPSNPSQVPMPVTPTGNRSKKTRDTVEGALCPFTLIASDTVYYNYFTIDGFENLLGPASKLLRGKSVDVETKAAPVVEKAREIAFDSTKFKMKCILGTGSFGVVLMAEYRPNNEPKPTSYALKCLSKVAVVETGQLRHVLDERKILAMMESIFILRLYGVYQTPHQLVMVTEALEHGDLWGVLYETAPYCEKGALDRSLALFYIASLVLALDHIHRAGVVFRDLKPENIMLDGKGYIRVIDFGFAKKVPYSKVDANGEEKVFSKTYTLCGTPGTNLVLSLMNINLIVF